MKLKNKLKNPVKAHCYRVVYKSINTGLILSTDVIDDCITTPEIIKTALQGIGKVISIKRICRYVENPLLEDRR